MTLGQFLRWWLRGAALRVASDEALATYKASREGGRP